MTALDLSVIMPEVRAVCDVLSGIPGSTTTDALQPFMFPQIGGDVLKDGSRGTNARAELTVEVLAAVGWGYDEWRQTYDPNAVIPGDTYVPALGGVVFETTGNRELRVQVKAESWDVRDGSAAQNYLERIRTGVYLPTIVDRFAAVGIATREITASHTANYADENGNRVSCAIFELVFNAADSAADDPVTTIEQVGDAALTVNF